ncbi:hypothetical protein GN956_G20850 [Arapaima gigas]
MLYCGDKQNVIENRSNRKVIEDDFTTGRSCPLKRNHEQLEGPPSSYTVRRLTMGGSLAGDSEGPLANCSKTRMYRVTTCRGQLGA